MFNIRPRLSSIFRPCLLLNRFSLSPTLRANSSSMKVSILGAGGRTGSCLSLFLKKSNVVDELAIFDIGPEISEIAVELGHIDTKCKVTCYSSNEKGLKATLDDSKIVVIAVGKCCDGRHFSQDNFIHNANIISECVPNIIRYCPTALVALVTSPINHLVPLIVEIYKKHGLQCYNRIFGVTSINSSRANAFVAEILQIEPESVMVPVIGGNCSKTCVPLFSQMKPRCHLTHAEISKLRYAVRMAEEEMTTIDFGRHQGNSSLSMGYAAARFCISLCRALRDEGGVVEFAYTRSCVIPEVTYLTGPLELGPCGIEKYLPLPFALSDDECRMLSSAIPHLRESIQLGEAVVVDPRDKSDGSTEISYRHSNLRQ